MNESFAEQAERYSGSLTAFVKAAWPVLLPRAKYVHGWHVDAICERLEAITNGEIKKLQFWVPPGSMKSLNVSVMWPAWEWTHAPWLRYMTASYGLKLATDLAVRGRDLVESEWYQNRWPHVQLKADENLKQSYLTTQGGARYVTAPTAKGGGTGKHADRILIDDPIDAQAAEATSAAVLNATNEWYDAVLPTRFADPKEGVEVIIMQRLHQEDLAAHALQMSDDWEVLCLPERYEAAHPYAWRGDPRKEGELLWPDRVGEKENANRRARLGAHRAAGQLQQRPSAREGDLLRRGHWRYYDKSLWDDPSKHAKFRMIVTSWDTAFKDKTTSDFVAGQVWGARGADRLLLRLTKERMALSATKRAIKEFDVWVRETFPGVPVYHLIEKSANGVEVISELKREITGITAVVASVDKVLRVEAAEPTLESGNCWLPGRANFDGTDYDPEFTPAAVQEFVESCSAFPNASHDDDVDAWSQAMNWLNARGTKAATFSSPEGAF